MYLNWRRKCGVGFTVLVSGEVLLKGKSNKITDKHCPTQLADLNRTSEFSGTITSNPCTIKHTIQGNWQWDWSLYTQQKQNECKHKKVESFTNLNLRTEFLASAKAPAAKIFPTRSS
ncbi:hypothetical protein F0562_015909 [Nyssa sinensis]|uniref:Uncharacterized protein n=1 Tax=Nyssa sinensis TaxID=561372 RepID=A0A5J4ZIL7_9ASTE|nr:hypothetical protein F0562_015909 [Nyssa sinensis]